MLGASWDADVKCKLSGTQEVFRPSMSRLRLSILCLAVHLEAS